MAFTLLAPFGGHPLHLHDLVIDQASVKAMKRGDTAHKPLVELASISISDTCQDFRVDYTVCSYERSGLQVSVANAG